MNFKVRQHIRRAEEKLSVSPTDQASEFVDFYRQNLAKRGRKSFVDFRTFPAAFAASQARRCGEILRADWPDGKPAAMVFLLWGRGTMYYLLSTRSDDPSDNGSIPLLIWTAMKRAHDLGLIFDLDGVSSSGTARFLSGFGGRLRERTIVRRSSSLYSVLGYAKQRVLFGLPDGSSTFT